MDWKKCNWTISPNYILPLLFYALLLMLPSSIKASNNACDWTGSGLSISHHNRDVISIYLRCTAGKIIWNYPRGAIRILLRKPLHLQKNFRACLKIYPTSYGYNTDAAMYSTSTATATTTAAPIPLIDLSRPNITSRSSSITNNNNVNTINEINTSKMARIFLEAPKRLISLFDGDNEVIVKCFRSINEQVALYVEAEETPFENMQTIFKYNLEFINNKHYSIRPETSLDVMVRATTTTTTTPTANHFNNDHILNEEITLNKRHRFNRRTETIEHRGYRHNMNNNNDHDAADSIGTWWLWWQRWRLKSEEPNAGELVRNANNEIIIGDSDQDNDAITAHNQDNGKVVDEKITGILGETYEICRPCTDIEMAHAYCSSDIVVRGIMFGIQEQPTLGTIEIAVKQTKVLRNNMRAISDAEDVWRHYQINEKKRKTSSKKSHQPYPDDISALTFHTPQHCLVNHESGEFVFMGRRRFEEMMIICSARLSEWATIVNTLSGGDNAPCILNR